MAKQIIDLKNLQHTAEHYDVALRMLPHLFLKDFVEEMHFNLLEVDLEDRRINLRREGNLLKPYDLAGTNTPSDATLMAVDESILRVHTGYLALQDNIQNYREKKLLMEAGRMVDNTTKKHPYESQILEAVIKTFTEDITVAIPFAKYGSGNTPLGVFDGINTVIDKHITANNISKDNHNLITTPAIEPPKSDTDFSAVDTLIGFLRELHPILRNGPLDIIISQEVFGYILDTFEMKRRFTGDIAKEQLESYLQVKASLLVRPNIIANPLMGAGQRIIACRPGSFSVGLGYPSDTQFVQVRSINPDPNIVQFWIQANIGTRLDDWHCKVFATNGGTITPIVGLNGDYVSAQ